MDSYLITLRTMHWDWESASWRVYLLTTMTVFFLWREFQHINKCIIWWYITSYCAWYHMNIRLSDLYKPTSLCFIHWHFIHWHRSITMVALSSENLCIMWLDLMKKGQEATKLMFYLVHRSTILTAMQQVRKALMVESVAPTDYIAVVGVAET